MPKDNKHPSQNSEENNSSSFDLYSDDKTKEIVGSLFDEFVEDGGTNYFANYSDPFLDSESEEADESLKDSISRRRKRSISSTNKSIVFRKKTKKVKPQDDEIDTYDEELDTEASEENDLEKTIVLPKLTNFFKKSSDKDEQDEDDEIDEFFAGLAKDSAARAQASATQENEFSSEQPSSNKKSKKQAISQPANDITDNEASISNLDSASDSDLALTHRKRKQKPDYVEPKYNNNDVEDEDDEEFEEKLVEISLFKIAGIVILVISVVIITALAYKNHSLTKQLNEAREQIAELQKSSSSTYETELNELKQQVSQLTAENESLKANEAAADDPHAAAVEILNEAQSEISTAAAPNTSISQEQTAGNTYTVKSGDTFWKISQSVYGNGADFQKILDANGLTENSVLNEGQVLKIPN